MFEDLWSEKSGLTTITSFLGQKEAKIDNWVFRLHYYATTLLFVGYSALVTMTTYAGDPIDCEHGSDEDWGDYTDWFCFLHGTETAVRSSPGGGRVVCLEEELLDGTCQKIQHPHYMWIALVVLAQGGISFIPHYFWLGWEGGRMARLVGPLLKKAEFTPSGAGAAAGLCKCQQPVGQCGKQGPGPHIASSGDAEAKELAKDFLAEMGHNFEYGFKQAICEWGCLVVAYLQILITDTFLNGNFTHYGTEVLQDSLLDSLDRTDPMGRTFPTVTSCTLHKFGSGFNGETTSAICVLPNNVVHQKFYLFLWFWLAAVAAATLLHQIYRLALLFVPEFRAVVTRQWWTVTTVGDSVKQEVEKVVQKMSYSDWVVFSLFQANLTTVDFHRFLEEVAFQYEDLKSQ